jgi:antitoxin component YwqK of YwqJK toxin-antitoxin module
MKSFNLLFAISFFSLIQSCSTVGQKIVGQKERLNEEKIIEGKLLRVGLWVETIDSVIRIANYRDGLKQGMVKTLYKNGEYSIAKYEDNLQEGWEKFYRKDGVEYLAILYEKGNVVARKSFTPSF